MKRALFFLGFSTLFLELSLIRYLAGNIWNMGYFPNLVLLACFVGMGLGFIFHHYFSPRTSNLLFQSSVFLLLGLLVFIYYGHPAVPGMHPDFTDLDGELLFTSFTKESHSTSYLPFIICFLTTIIIFSFISQRTAKLFLTVKPLTAYTLDIAGSCAGIVAFMGMSLLRAPPCVWFTVFIIVFLMTMPEVRRYRWLPLLPGVLIFFITEQQDRVFLSSLDLKPAFKAYWSPYQKLEHILDSRGTGFKTNSVWTNGAEHQRMLSQAEIQDLVYSQIFNFRAKSPDLPPYKSVLIIGCGTGNDVAAALKYGAEHVTAVDIDPVIIKLGRKHHPEKPFNDPRVTVIVNDGRAVLTQTEQRYDLILYALTDSLVKVSSLGQLRLENYLFTKESLSKAYSLLTDYGELVLYNYYRQAWLVEKIKQTVIAATGRRPWVSLGDSDMFAITSVNQYATYPSVKMFYPEPVEITVDDWPFLYLKNRSIPAIYRNAMIGTGLIVALLLLALQLLSRNQVRFRGLDNLFLKLAFLFMGVAFLLLETKSVVQFSLLFGTTWLNNSLVFLAVLLLVLAANWTAMLFRQRWVLWLVFPFLLLSTTITLLYPLYHLLEIGNPFLRFILASLMTFAPIFFANLIFSSSFRDQAIPEHIFGWNLIGSTIGGILEYTSMILGYNNLALIVTLSYFLVLVCLALATKLAVKKG